MLVRRLIIKFYLLLVITVATLGFSIDYFLQQEIDNDIQKNNSNYHLATALYLDTLLLSNPKKNWPDKIENASKELSIAIQLLTPADIDIEPITMNRLTQGELIVVALDNKDLLLRKLTGLDYFIQIEFPISDEQNTTWVAVFYLFLVIPILFWFWPLAQNLKQLEHASKQIAKNNFDYRIADAPNSAINSISQTFNTMAERIKYLIEEQKSLTSAVSHEIRTPLARLKFALELQKKNQTDSTEEKQIDAMQIDVEELSNLVDEMLSYAKLDKVDEAIELQQVPADLWVRSVVEECQKSNQRINIEIICSIKTVTIDPHLMARAVSNLIHNAFRFARNKITIQLNSTKDGFNIQISDDGPGIPEKQRERLFEPFAQIDKSRNQKHGFGLGLAIVKRIVEKHNGQINITDSTIGGAQFELTFSKTKLQLI